MLDWYDDEAFWDSMAPKLFTPLHWETAPFEVESALMLLGLAPGSHVLDLCCGPGRHSLELARRGFEVTGVDRTARYLEEARRRARKEDLDVEFVQEDMRAFCRPAAFDASLNLYSSFGYFEDPEDDRRVLANVHSSLREGGKLLLDLMGKEVVARIFRERDWREENGILFLEERRLAEGWSWIENRWITIDHGRRAEFNFRLRLYSGGELSSLLCRCGFGSVSLFGDLTGTPYDHAASRLVAVAAK